jgi:hypothetical protein
MKLDGEICDIAPFDAIRVAPKVARSFEAGPERDLELLAFGPRHSNDGELLRGDFWEGEDF